MARNSLMDFHSHGPMVVPPEFSSMDFLMESLKSTIQLYIEWADALVPPTPFQVRPLRRCKMRTENWEPKTKRSSFA